MQITRAADYAVRIMTHLATLPAGSCPNRAALAKAGEIPEHFVSKVLQSLARARLINSHRGVNGGVTLARDPAEISMLDVVEAMEGPTRLNVCLKSNNGCTRVQYCPAHLVWMEAQDSMVAVLRRASIASLVRP